jgi:hypothetical protein
VQAGPRRLLVNNCEMSGGLRSNLTGELEPFPVGSGSLTHFLVNSDYASVLVLWKANEREDIDA